MTLVKEECPMMEAQQADNKKENLKEMNSDDDSGHESSDINSRLPYTHHPPQVNMPEELALKLERQDSYESVGSIEEGIQADADSEGNDGQETTDSRTDGLEQRSERSSSVVSDASEEGGRDSGIEAEREPDMVIPDEDLIARIVTQVEFYFSDANVIKDKFLLKHIRRNKEGYVSLKLVSSFKKVKQLTKDWRVVAHSLTKSSCKIQLNEQGSKIRRTDPLPEIDDTPVTRAVLALTLPLEKPSIENVSQLFSSCGEIAFIRVLRAGGTLPPDVKPLVAKYQALNDSNCAWIEFETPEAAKAASEMTSDENMKVVPILPESQKKQEKQNQQKNQQSNSRKNSLSNIQQKGSNSRKNSYVNKSRKDSINGFENEEQGRRIIRRKAISLPHTQTPNLGELSAIVDARRGRPKSKSCTEYSPSNSWIQRHLLAAAAASAASAASPIIGSRPPTVRGSRTSHGSLPLPDGVVRFPRGPGTGRGFSSDFRKRTITEGAVC